jgi:processive 1,2-diacylglycerol beta-glucosyltransferase
MISTSNVDAIMQLNWPQNQNLYEDTKTLTRCFLTSDDIFLEETLTLLDECKNRLLSEEECENLKKLAKRGELVVVDRYLDLQLGDRLSEENDDLFSFATQVQESWLLANALGKYVLCPQESDFLAELTIKWVQKSLYTWLASLKIAIPVELRNLDEADPLGKMRQILEHILKMQNSSLDLKDKLFIEELLKGIEQNKDTLSYLTLFFSSLEQLNFWEERLIETRDRLIHLREIPLEVREISVLKENLASFEREILSFHEDLGHVISHLICGPLSEPQKSIIIGKFRRSFQEINNAYGDFKGKLLGIQTDEHLCCMCHFSKNITMNWPIKNAVIDLYEGNPPIQKQEIASDHPRQNSTSSILIFTCGGGAGHLSATKAMGQSASGKYHVLVASTLEDTLAANDILRKLTFDFTGEKFYNHLMKNEEFEWVKLITSLGPFFYMMQQKRIEYLIRLEVLKQSPDMLISCFPLMNAMILNVAKEFNLPLLIVPTDLDSTLFMKGMNPTTCDLNYPNYRITLSYEDPEMRNIIECIIPKNRIDVSGFPVRGAFNQEYSREEMEQVRKKFQIPENEKVILVMMGGNAGRSIETYADIFADCTDEDLVECNEKLHIVCICGDQRVTENQEMKDRINNLVPKSSQIKIKGIPGTAEIAKLMSIADVLISKPGGCSTNEAIARKLPMIFHAPFALMDWEVFNMKFAIRNKIGARFKIQSNTATLFNGGMKKNKKKLLPLIKDALNRRNELKNGGALFEKKDFGKEFLRLVKELIPLK